LLTLPVEYSGIQRLMSAMSEIIAPTAQASDPGTVPLTSTQVRCLSRLVERVSGHVKMPLRKGSEACSCLVNFALAETEPVEGGGTAACAER